MDVRNAVNLLTITVFAMFCLLGTVVLFTLSASAQAEAAATPLAWCGTGNISDEFGGEYAAGKKVWNSNGCGACHNKSMATDATGPALGGVTERWADYPRTDLHEWVRNNGKLRATGHPRALEIYNEWNGAAMNTYPNLKNGDIENLLAYIEGQYH